MINMKLVYCSICGKEFYTDAKNKKYCSLICKEAGRKLHKSLWDENNANYITEYMRTYRANKREAVQNS